jgi:hypothetical protein
MGSTYIRTTVLSLKKMNAYKGGRVDTSFVFETVELVLTKLVIVINSKTFLGEFNC